MRAVSAPELRTFLRQLTSSHGQDAFRGSACPNHSTVRISAPSDRGRKKKVIASVVI